ncbi:MAG: NIPSNAP family protein [Bacteroidota bacterium]
MKTFNLFVCLLSICILAGFTQGLAQQPTAKVYWMQILTVSLGKLPDYHTFAEKEMRPLQEKHGYQFVAGWQTIIGDIEEVILVAEFDNMDAYLKARMSLLASAEYKSLQPKVDALLKGIRTRMMTAVPYVKMK